MMPLLGRIKQAFKTLVSGDSSAYPQGQGRYNQKTTDFIRLSTYGICANAPKGSHVFLIGSQGMESTKFGIENDFLNRLKGLKQGEVALYNTLTQSFVFLKENGDVEVSGADVVVTATGEVVITAPAIKLIGDVEVTGTITATGTVQGSELTDGSVPYSTHIHGGVDPGAGTSGGPQ